MEIVRAFPGCDGLRRFKEWVEAPDMETLLEAARSSGISAPVALPYGDAAERVFKRSHRSARKTWHLPPDFPSARVAAAYSDPKVDRSCETFEWGAPDVAALQTLLWEKLSRPPEWTAHALQAAVSTSKNRDNQLRIDAFFTSSHALGPAAKASHNNLSLCCSRLTSRVR